MVSLLWFLLIGLLAGWLASRLMKSSKQSSLGKCLLVGCLGAIVGGVLVNLLGFAAYGLLASIVTATLGAMLLLWIFR